MRYMQVQSGLPQLLWILTTTFENIPLLSTGTTVTVSSFGLNVILPRSCWRDFPIPKTDISFGADLIPC